jgi:hypothetical protein
MIYVRKISITLDLCSFKVHVNDVKLYSESTEVKSVYKKCFEKETLGSVCHQAFIHLVIYEFQNDFNT